MARSEPQASEVERTRDGYLRSVLIEVHTALREAEIDHALIGGLALAAHHCERATVDLDLLADGARAEDIDRLLLARAEVDLERVREYFRLFDREKELDALLAERDLR